MTTKNGEEAESGDADGSGLYRARGRATAAAAQVRVFAHPHRLMILSRLLQGECTVGEIDSATGIGQPALSQQLAQLRRAATVRTRREARQIHYSLADAHVATCVRTIEAMFGGSRTGAAASVVREGGLEPP